MHFTKLNKKLCEYYVLCEYILVTEKAKNFLQIYCNKKLHSFWDYSS